MTFIDRFTTEPLSHILRVLVVIAVGVVTFLVVPPTTFPTDAHISVPEGAVLGEVATLLKEKDIIKSPTLFTLLVTLAGEASRIQAGTYHFDTPLGVAGVVERFTSGDLGMSPLSVRIPEGVTRLQMATLLADTLPLVDVETFLERTEEKEGYLFPDTYLFLPTVTTEEVVTHLEDTFFEKTHTIEESIIASGRTLEELVIMASLIEREAFDPTDRRLISGVLYNRLAIGMALQLDAPLYFLTGKASSELTLDDLAIDSPYNTYVYPGLPPGPIAAPSLDAILAAAEPTPSEYLFYLSDADGVTHFAEDFETHKRNKERYLR